MNRIKGDLIQLALDGEFDLIIHGCNCHCLMGAGIAKQIRLNFPEAWAADLATAPGDPAKLGQYSSARIKKNRVEFYVINAYTQYDHSGPGILADYTAIESVFNRIRTDFSGLRMGYPRIGAGLARGDWSVICQIIDTALAGEAHTLVERPDQ